MAARAYGLPAAARSASIQASRACAITAAPSSLRWTSFQVGLTNSGQSVRPSHCSGTLHGCGRQHGPPPHPLLNRWFSTLSWTARETAGGRQQAGGSSRWYLDLLQPAGEPLARPAGSGGRGGASLLSELLPPGVFSMDAWLEARRQRTPGQL